jgi:hypothetical protein
MMNIMMVLGIGLAIAGAVILLYVCGKDPLGQETLQEAAEQARRNEKIRGRLTILVALVFILGALSGLAFSLAMR